MDKLAEVLQKLADTLGLTVKELYPYFVRQAALEATIAVSAGCAMFVIGAVLLGMAWRCGARWNDEATGDDSAKTAGAVIVGAVLVLAGAVSAFANLASALCPEPTAVKNIMRLVTGG